MRDEIIKKNLIITITSLLLFFLFSFFATNYSIRSTFEKEVVSVSQMVENQLESENSNDVDVINNFTYNQTWLKIVYATNTGLIIVDSDDDNIAGVNRIDDEKLNLLNNVEQKDRIYIVDNIIYYITIILIGLQYRNTKHNLGRKFQWKFS